MGNVYSLDAERNLILYHAGTNIYIRSTFGENVMRPIVLCTDYRSSFTDTAFNGTVYYAYYSMEQDILVRSINDLQNIYKISSQEIPGCHNPRIVTFQGELILFYTTKSPLNNAYYLKALFPLKPDVRIKLPETSFSEIRNFGILAMSDRLILDVSSQETQILFALKPDFELVVYPSDSASLETQLHDALQELHLISETLRDTRQEFDAVSAQLADEQLLFKDLQERNKELESEIHAKEQAHSETLESIRAQYNELMETAIRYKNEAARWHDIACRKEVKPVPGESLIADSW
ncbi:MAG: hypothetical protein NC094_09750 [Bacteroidales bacterium]|nr:hypothetical protein [Lachnoclostridium sp.]MCM1383609.1 hypothetical protein [Lachnoclostridium sp.]MCM1465691.1 hypothetical protein [Bacteroidales bacterium]